jgi:hypothetical protein
MLSMSIVFMPTSEAVSHTEICNPAEWKLQKIVIEKQRNNKNIEVSPETLAQHGLERLPSGYIQWQKDSIDHPRNWSYPRKLYDTSIIIFLEFYT